jgi:hypothetical protein
MFRGVVELRLLVFYEFFFHLVLNMYGARQ